MQSVLFFIAFKRTDEFSKASAKLVAIVCQSGEDERTSRTLRYFDPNSLVISFRYFTEPLEIQNSLGFMLLVTHDLFSFLHCPAVVTLKSKMRVNCLTKVTYPFHLSSLNRFIRRLSPSFVFRLVLFARPSCFQDPFALVGLLIVRLQWSLCPPNGPFTTSTVLISQTYLFLTLFLILVLFASIASFILMA